MNCQLASESIFYQNALYRFIHDAAGTFVPCSFSHVIAGLAIMLMLVNSVLLGAALVTWLERRLLGGCTIGLAQIDGAHLDCSSQLRIWGNL